MDFSITEEQRMFRDNIVRFSREVLNKDVAERDREQKFSPELWKQCAEIGIQGLPVPEEYGGSGLDPLSCAIALEALGYGCTDGGLVFSLCAHLLSCVVPMWLQEEVTGRDKINSSEFGLLEQTQPRVPRRRDIA